MLRGNIYACRPHPAIPAGLIDRQIRVYARIMIPTTCACTKLRRSARAVTALYDAALEPTGLTTPQFSLLRMLVRSGPCSVTGLSERTGHERTSISRMVAGLRDRGLIALTPAGDHRERIVTITPGGEAAIESARAGWEAAEARIDAILGDDRATLFGLLDRIEGLRP